MAHLQLFGRPHLQGLDPAGARAGQRHRLALLALLATARDAGVSRDKLIALLWPEADAARGRHLLSNSVYVLRQALGGDVIRAGTDALSLDCARLPSDVACFLGALDRGDDAAAVECCGPPFMDGFFLAGAEEFEHWLEQERERLCRACAAALERLAERAEAAGDYRAAAASWERLAGVQPYSCQTALRLMHALARAGEPARAIQHARLHEQRLRADLEVEPAGEVLELAASLAHAAPASSNTLLHAVRTAAPNTSVIPAAARLPREFARMRRWPALLLVGLVLAVAVGAAVYRFNSNGGPEQLRADTHGPFRSIAVLPFVNLGGNPEDEYLGDGLTEELLHLLSQLDGMRVAARTSAFAFKNQHADIEEIGRQLGVEMVLEGSVRRVGERVRITAQLVNVADGYHLWSRTYEQRDPADIFAIQDEISRLIVSSLLPRLAHAPLPGHGTSDARAFDHYLKGRYAFWQAASAADLARAIEHYRAAIARDPAYALAWAGIADAYMLLGGRPRENMPRARAAAERALALDPELSEGYVSLASISWFYDWDWQAAELNYRRSFSVNRVIYTRCICYVWYLVVVGDVDGAVREAQRARALDPVGLLPLATLARVYLVSGRNRELRDALPQLRAAGADAHTLAYLEAWLAWNQHRPADALRELERLRAGREPREMVAALSSDLVASLAIFYGGVGRLGDARDLAIALQRRAPTTFVPPEHLAAAFAAAGDTAQASAWIRTAFAERANLAYFASMPLAEPLRVLPAFREALRAVRVPAQR